MQVFVDESKAGGFLLIASVMVPADVAGARRNIRTLLLPGQKRLHMKTEGDPRKKLILSRFQGWGYGATIYRAGPDRKRELDRREACLERLVADLATGMSTSLCLESDESLDARDRAQLRRFVRQYGCAETLGYGHARAAQEPLLAIPDAIGWAWARGGDWRRRTIGMVADVIDVDST